MADPETASATLPKSKKRTALTADFASKQAKLQSRKVEIPKPEVPTMEISTALREIAEQTMAQTREAYDRARAATDQATNVMENTYSAAAKGYSDYGCKLIEVARVNTNAAFDLFGELLGAKSYSDAVEKSSAFMRAQFDTFAAQSKELSEQAQKICADTTTPLRESFTNSAKAT